LQVYEYEFFFNTLFTNLSKEKISFKIPFSIDFICPKPSVKNKIVQNYIKIEKTIILYSHFRRQYKTSHDEHHKSCHF